MYEGVIQNLIDELGRLPGVGPKGAQRIAFHLLAADPADPEETARTIADLVLAAVRDAYRAAEALQQQQMGPLAAVMSGSGMPGGLNLPSGLDLSGLGIGGPAQPEPKGPDEDEDKP